MEVGFVESAFKHGYEPEDFFEVLNNQPLKLRSRRGLEGVCELYGRNGAGDYLHVAYRKISGSVTVFHMRRMTTREAKDVSETTMKPSKPAGKSIRLPGKNASYTELADFFDRHDGTDLMAKGITAIDPDRSDLDQMLLRYWREPNTKQLNIRIPATAKRMIERLARRKTVEVSTLVRMWVIESMRREATGR